MDIMYILIRSPEIHYNRVILYGFAFVSNECIFTDTDDHIPSGNDGVYPGSGDFRRVVFHVCWTAPEHIREHGSNVGSRGDFIPFLRVSILLLSLKNNRRF